MIQNKTGAIHLESMSFDPQAAIYTLDLTGHDNLDDRDIEKLEEIMGSQPMVAVAGLGEKTAIYAQCFSNQVDPDDHRRMIEAVAEVLATAQQRTL